MSNRGKIPKKLTIEQEDKVYSHLTTIHRNLQYITGFFPRYFTQDENSEEDEQDVCNIQGPNEEINTDDVNLERETTANFDKTYRTLEFQGFKQTSTIWKYDGPEPGALHTEKE